MKLFSYMLDKETTPRSLKNLIMLTGGKKENGRIPFKRVNNSRTRRLILQFIFDRDNLSLDSLAIKYKTKVRKLVTHAMGEPALHKIWTSPTPEIAFRRSKIARYNNDSFPVLLHLFNMPFIGDPEKFPKINLYHVMKEAAKAGDEREFIRVMKMKKLPFETVLGFRNTYKIDVPLRDVHESTTKTDRQKLQTESATARAGAKVSVDYNKQNLFDLLKIFYHKTIEQDSSNIDDIVTSIEKKSETKSDVSFGKAVVIMDCSHSMRGNAKRHLHPFLVGMSLILTIDNLVDIMYTGGTWIKTQSDRWKQVIYPEKQTCLWESLLTAAAMDNVDSIIIISDGYENSPMKGMFSKVYKKLRQDGYLQHDSVIHINPVFASESKGVKQLDPDIPVLPVSSHKSLEAVFISNMLLAKPDQVKALLVNKYQKLIAKGSS